MNSQAFQELVWVKGRELYRDMPWREQPTFYYVLVSEIMLQQTQVARVIQKFAEFINAFPTIDILAAAPLAEVLRIWQGLGYNRRAKFMHEAAKQIVMDGQPKDYESLLRLPGIGKNTAAAIMNYVYQVPTPFVETNIRTVYFYHFFRNQRDVSDKQLRELVQKTVDTEHPREFFWALMDYGSLLKSQGYGNIAISKHYKKQPPLSGSLREMRGKIVRALSAVDLSKKELQNTVQADDRFSAALHGLVADGLICIDGDIIHLTR